jgi:hypothetical protein
MDGEFLFVTMGRIYSGFSKGSAKIARILMFRLVFAGKQSTAPVQQYGSRLLALRITPNIFQPFGIHDGFFLSSQPYRAHMIQK